MRKFIRGLPWDDLNEIRDDSVLSWFKLADSTAPPKASNNAIKNSDALQNEEDEAMDVDGGSQDPRAGKPNASRPNPEDAIMHNGEPPANASHTPQGSQVTMDAPPHQDAIMHHGEPPANASHTPQGSQVSMNAPPHQEGATMRNGEPPANASHTQDDERREPPDNASPTQDDERREPPRRSERRPPTSRHDIEDDEQRVPPPRRSEQRPPTSRLDIEDEEPRVPPTSGSDEEEETQYDERRVPPTSRSDEEEETEDGEQEVSSSDRINKPSKNAEPNFRIVTNAQGYQLRPRLQTDTDKILGKRTDAPQTYANNPKKAKTTVQHKLKVDFSKVGHSSDAPIDVDELFVSINPFVFIIFPQTINLVRAFDHP